MKGITLLALLCVCLAPTTTIAQQTPGPRYAPLRLQLRTVTLTNTKPRTLDVSNDRHTHVIRDVFIGTIAGAAAGVLIGSSTNKGSKEDRELAGLSGAILGAGVGALVGGVIGFTHKSTSSAPVTLVH
ncbi:MAG: glycine zipper domain-containing protein [Gemmatimonadaceae bacterium]